MSKARQLADKSTAPAGRRNLIINGAMQISQRGTSFTDPATGSTICDRWGLTYNHDAAVDWSQSTDAPDGFKYSLKADVTTADTSLSSGQYKILYYRGAEVQDVEHLLYGTSSAKELTLSFWVKSTKTGTYSAELAFDNGTTQVEHSRAYTINASDTWEKKELTFDANTTDSFGNSANGQGLIVYFWLAAGSTFSGSPRSSTWENATNRATDNVNFLDSTSNEFYITGVQLEVGSTATEFEHRSYGEELALCQRYFYSTLGTLYGGDYGSNSFTRTEFPVAMRVAPTVTGSNNKTVLSTYHSVQRIQYYLSGNASALAAGATADAEL